MKKQIVIILMVLFTVYSCTTTDSNNYQNPIFSPDLADPSIIRADDGVFYAYGTQNNWGDNKSKLVPIIKSENLVDWEYIGNAFEKSPTWKTDGTIWAPDIVKYNSKYYLYYSISSWGDQNPGLGVAISDTPEGPFTDKGKLFTSKEIGVKNSIDPAFYVDDDGTPYLFWGSFYGIYAVELAKDGFSVVGDKIKIASSNFEAPYIIKRDGYFYFFGSAGTCCEGENSLYHVLTARSEKLIGPYFDMDGINLTSSYGTLVVMGDSDLNGKAKNFAGPGHNAVISDDSGQDWLFYHAIDLNQLYLPGGATRRPLMLDPLQWDDGWPYIKDFVPGSNMQIKPYINFIGDNNE